MPGMVGVIACNVQGDIGGQGISRFHVKRVDNTQLTPADCTAAMAAMRKLWNAAATNMPNKVSWSWQSQVTIIDEATAGLLGYVNASNTPLNVNGQDASAYPAGVGLRIDWLTSTIENRRLMRAANFIVPLTSAGFNNSGQVLPTFQATMSTAAGTCLSDMAAAQLELVAYHRPPKGTQIGGFSGVVTAYRIPLTPATLRSRRV